MSSDDGSTRAAAARPPDDPRTTARERALRGCVLLARLVFVVALVEIGVSALSAIVAPEPMPIVLRDLANFARAIYGGLAVLFTARFVGHARYSGAQPFALAAVGSFVIATLAGALPFFAVVPEGMEDALWDALLQVVRTSTFVAGTGAALWTVRAFAQHTGQTGIVRTTTWLFVPLVATLPTAFQAIEPTLVPTPWLGPLLALVVPLVLAAASVMRWDVALWSTLGIAALGGVLLFPTPTSLAAATVGMVGVLTLTALTLQAVLFELAATRDAPSDTVSRTLLRGLMGSLGSGARDSSRLGDLDPNASRPPTDEQSADAESLARAYRELDIETQRHPVPTDDVPVPPATILPLVPKRGSLDKRPSEIASAPEAVADDGRLAAIVVLPVAWNAVHQGFNWIFAALVARVLVTVFGLLLSAPLGDQAVALALFDLASIAATGCLVRGLYPLRHAPLDPLRKLGMVAVTLAIAMLVVEIAGSGMRFYDLREPLVAADACLAVATLAVYLIALVRLHAHLGLAKVRGRARGTLVLLAVWSAFALATAITTRLGASDLRWLAFPLGFATAAVGLGLWIGLLWLTRDTQETLRP